MMVNAFIRWAQLLVTVGLFAGPLGAQDTNTALVGWWRFEEGAGNLAADTSGSGNHLRYVLTENPVWTNGRFGSGVYFHGVPSNSISPTNIIFFSNAAAFDYGIMKVGCETSNWTLCSWIWSDSIQNGGERGIVGRPGGHMGMLAYSNTPTSQSLNVKYVNGASATSNIPFKYAFNDSKWHMVTVVFTNRTWYTYFDGNPVLSWAMPAGENFSINTTQLNIGGFNSALYNYPFKGIIDDVRIYNRALTPADIAFLYNPPPVSTILTGRLLTADGYGIAGVNIAASNTYWNGGGRITGADGSFSMELPANTNLTLSLTAQANLPLAVTLTNISVPATNFSLIWTNSFVSPASGLSFSAPPQFFTSKDNPLTLVVCKTNADRERVLVRAVRANAGDSFSLWSQFATGKTVLVQVAANEVRRLLNTGAYIVEVKVVPQGRAESDLDLPTLRKLVVVAQ